MIKDSSINPTPTAYDRTVLPYLSGMKGIAKAATRGNRRIVVSQGNSATDMMRINTYSIKLFYESFVNLC